METLLHVGLSNMIVATVLALVAAAVGCFCRRPALVHSLWLLVLVKLVTPTIVPVRIAWPTALEPAISHQADASSAASLEPPSPLPARDLESTPVAERLPAVSDPGANEPPVFLPELARPAAVEPEQAVASSEPATVLPPPAPTPTWSVEVDWRAVIGSLWLAGALCWTLLASVRVARFRRLLPHSRPAPDSIQQEAERLAGLLGLSRCPRVWLVAGAVSPMLWSLAGPPRLLLPAGLLEHLSAEQRATLLAHELAHLRRRDHWVRGLELLVMALYWWFPLVWWVRQELREAEEQCCDAWVVWALPDSARAYALAIVATLDFLSGTRSAVPLAASGMGPVHSLRRRLTMIMRGTTPRALSLAGILAVVGLGVLVLPWLPVQAQDPPEKLRGADRNERPDPRNVDLDQAKREIDQLHEHMRRLQEQVEAAERRLKQAQRRLAQESGAAPRREVPPDDERQAPPRASRGAATPPLPALPPMAPGGRAGMVPPGAPGMAGPGGMGARSGMPGMLAGGGAMAGGHPSAGDLDRRLREIDWKLDALLKQMDDLRHELRREQPAPAGGIRSRSSIPPATPSPLPSPSTR